MSALSRLFAALQLTRIALVFTAISNAWVVVLLSAAFGEKVRVTEAYADLPLWVLLLCTAGVAAGLYSFGMALNDVLDARRDRAFAPERPLPSGQLSMPTAVAVTVGALLIAVAAAIPLGRMSTLLCLVTAGLILFYNALAKHVPGVGVLSLGLIRAVHMLIANPALLYLWPVWLTLTHVVGISAAGYTLERKRPLMSPTALWLIVGGWVFVTVVMLAWMTQREAPFVAGALWLGPLLAATAFGVLMVPTLGRAPDGRAAGGLLVKRGLLWLIVYDAAWLVSAGLWWQAGLIALLGFAAVGGMTVMRHLKALQQPARFQRDG